MPKFSLFVKLSLTIALVGFVPTLSIQFLHLNLWQGMLVTAIFATSGIALIFINLNPLKTILKITSELKSGQYNAKLDIRSADEFEQLAKTINSMTNSLQQALQFAQQNQYTTVAEKNRLDTVLSSIIDGIVAVDLYRNVVFINKAAEAMIGFSANEVVNRPISQFIRLYDGQEELTVKDYCQVNIAGDSTQGLLTSHSLLLVGRDGKQTKVSLLTAPINGEIQSNLGCILIFHDLAKEQELEQMKLDFVSMASHELRTPLTSIIGYLSVFSEENQRKIPKEEMELIDRSLVASKQLLTLVGNLLSVNKIEREQMTLTPQPVDWQALLQKAVDDLQNQAKFKNITLELKPPSIVLSKVMADPLRVNEVINNLIANAINYTNSGGKIIVLTTATPNEVITTVSDNGIGIPSQAIPHLFNKFFRVSNQLQTANKGTGLGLYISKSIITKLGGKIWIESEVGKGTKVSFSLPIASISAIDTNQFVGQAIQSGALNY